MEQAHRASGGSHDINPSDQLNSHEEHGYQEPGPGPHPPLTFAEAAQLNGYTTLDMLHDHALFVAVSQERAETASNHLAELALSSAVVAIWSRWQPITMHKAFTAGASLAEVAAATGVSGAEAYDRWSAWAEQQAEITIPGVSLLDLDEVEAIRARIESA